MSSHSLCDIAYMCCQTMVASPHVEHHQHDNRTGSSSISSLLNRTRADSPHHFSKEERSPSPSPSPQRQPARRESDQMTIAAYSSSSGNTPLVSPISPYQHLPTPKSPAIPMRQHGYDNNKKYSAKNHHLPPPSSPTKATVVVRHYEMIPRSTEDTSGGIYASFSLKDTSSSARQHNRSSSSRVASASTPRPFACTECDQTFSRAHNLKSHFATHSADRPFKCDSCTAKFRRLHDLKRHQKLHTGERPYICSTCQRCFSRLDALNRHQRTEGSSACHYRRRSSTTPTINIEETLSPITAPASPPQPPQNRPNIPHLDLRHLNTNDRITLPSPNSHHQQRIHHSTPSPPPPPPPSSSSSPLQPDQQYHHHHHLPPPYRFSESPENFASLQIAYAKLYDQYRSTQEGMHSRTQADEDEVNSLRQSLYDLQVENRVLRSLVVERHPNKDDTMNKM